MQSSLEVKLKLEFTIHNNMSSPWAKIEKPEPVNLNEIISEEVAKELQAREEKKIKQYQEISTLGVHFGTVSETPIEIQSDFVKAIPENIFDSDKTFNKFQGFSLTDDFVSDSDEEVEDINIGKQLDKLNTFEFTFASAPSFYKIQKDGKIITTYAKNKRKDNSKISSLQLGHSKKFNLKLSNEVFNRLKRQSKHDQAWRFKFFDKEEDQIITDFGLDMFTRCLLYQMINNQLLEQVNDVISIGKEAVILHADLGRSCPSDFNLPKECAIKIFRLTNLELKQVDTYIKDNHASKDKIVTESVRKAINIWNETKKRPTHKYVWRKENDQYVWDRKEIKYPQYLHSNNILVNNNVDELVTRKTVRNLAENEMNVLIRLEKAQVPCPKFIELKKHILVMSFIGKNQTAAPSLKSVTMTTAEYAVAYNQVIEGMKAMFEKANVIHTELLDNILWYQGQCYFIDFSQSVEPKDQDSFKYLFNNCTNVTDFFTKRGSPDVQPEFELFKYITGFDYRNKLL